MTVWFTVRVIIFRTTFFPFIFEREFQPPPDFPLHSLIINGTLILTVIVLGLSALSTWVTFKILKKIHQKHNIILIASMLVFAGLGINMIIRNIPYGILAVLIVTIINVLAVILLVAITRIKSKGFELTGKIVLVGWFLYGIYLSTSSANTDATLLMTIYAIAGALAIAFGNFQSHTEEN